MSVICRRRPRLNGKLKLCRSNVQEFTSDTETHASFLLLPRYSNHIFLINDAIIHPCAISVSLFIPQNVCGCEARGGPRPGSEDHAAGAPFSEVTTTARILAGFSRGAPVFKGNER